MPKQPARRPRRTDSLGDLNVPDEKTQRAVDALKEALERARQAVVTPTVSRLTLIRQRPTPTINESIFTSDIDGELYYRDSNGTDIRLTEDGFIAGSDVDVGPLPASISAVTVNASGDLDVNDAGNVIADLYVTNLHTTGSDSHGSRFVQMPAHLGGIVTGAPIYFTNGKGVGSAGGACSFHSNFPPLRRGDRILSISARLFRGVVAGTAQIQAYRVDNPIVSIGGPVSSTATPGGDLDLTISGLSVTVGAAESYTLLVQLPVSQDSFETITVEYDRP